MLATLAVTGNEEEGRLQQPKTTLTRTSDWLWKPETDKKSSIEAQSSKLTRPPPLVKTRRRTQPSSWAWQRHLLATRSPAPTYKEKPLAEGNHHCQGACWDPKSTLDVYVSHWWWETVMNQKYRSQRRAPSNRERGNLSSTPATDAGGIDDDRSTTTEHNRPPLKVDLARSELCLKVNPRKNHQAPPLHTHLTTAPDP